jgi:hypothetical protein
MILFVFEGAKAEPKVFDSIGKLFLSEEDFRIIRYKCDLPSLYSHLKANGDDLFRILPFKENGIDIPEGKRLDTLFSQIFLFFDYDFQNNIGLKNLNPILNKMLDFFDDETDNGKLYINYPMIESLKYTKEMPDKNYYQYVASMDECVKHQFKGNAEKFAYAGAKGFNFIDLSKTEKADVIANWENLKLQNVAKAKFLCKIEGEVSSMEDISQKEIFENQLSKYVEQEPSLVSILNSFPLFIYEYLGVLK